MCGLFFEGVFMKDGKTRISRLAFIASLAAAIAIPAWADTLVLRSGNNLSGTLTSATPSTITFRDTRGGMHSYSVRDVDSIQFGDAPYTSSAGAGDYRAAYNSNDN